VQIGESLKAPELVAHYFIDLVVKWTVPERARLSGMEQVDIILDEVFGDKQIDFRRKLEDRGLHRVELCCCASIEYTDAEVLQLHLELFHTWWGSRMAADEVLGHPRI
jgi:hypothetical protein